MIRAIGIDPGLTGGLACVTSTDLHKYLCGVIEVQPMPRLGDAVDAVGVADFIGRNKAPGGGTVIVLELAHARPGQGVSGVFKFGRVFGALEAVAALAEVPVMVVSPRRWQKLMFQGTPEKLEPKARARQAARRLFPGVDIRRTPRCKQEDEGIVDAILLAEYGRRTWR